MSDRGALQTAILEYVDAMSAAGTVIDADVSALMLSSKYPESGMTIDEVVREIEEGAVRLGAVLLTGTTHHPHNAA